MGMGQRGAQARAQQSRMRRVHGVAGAALVLAAQGAGRIDPVGAVRAAAGLQAGSAPAHHFAGHGGGQFRVFGGQGLGIEAGAA
ncbi:hypothetical protein SDC9_183857 [bioreactor metagenome]|uniref:Uncharacterized protein n=1 Tax=bioreactor metagenome TaxID=1076179 RepID=A0A645HBD7_9ZZZZ